MRAPLHHFIACICYLVGCLTNIVGKMTLLLFNHVLDSTNILGVICSNKTAHLHPHSVNGLGSLYKTFSLRAKAICNNYELVSLICRNICIHVQLYPVNSTCSCYERLQDTTGVI